MVERDDKADLIEDIREDIALYEEVMSDNISSAVEDMEFVNGDQWTAEEKKARGKRPTITVNKLASVIRQIIGNARQSTPAIKVMPVDDKADPKVADILSGIIKSIEYENNAAVAYETALESAIRGGWGFFRILTEYEDELAFDQKITIRRVTNPLSVSFDPASQDADLADARWFAVRDKITKDDFEARWPKAETSNSVMEQSSIPGEYLDWLGDDYVNICEYWYKEKEKSTLLLIDGQTVKLEDVPKELRQVALETAKERGRVREVETDCVYWCITNGIEILEGPTKWAGKHLPFCYVAGEETWIGEKRILRSLMHWAKEPQRLYNWSKSNLVETLALSPRRKYIGSASSIEGYEGEWNTAHESPKMFLPINDGAQPPQLVPNAVPDTANMQEMLTSSDEIKAVSGIYDASLGAKSNETSGVAIAARQRQGDAATFIYVDNLARAMQYAGKILVDLIPKIYDTERVVRLSDEAGKVWTESVNVASVDGARLNDLSIGRYDVRVDTGPAYPTRRVEAANGMLQFMQAFPPSAQVIGPRLASVLDWPEAQEIGEELKQLTQPPQQQQDPQAQQMQDQAQKQQQAAFQAELEVQQSTAAKNYASAEKSQADAMKVMSEMQMQVDTLQQQMQQLTQGRF